MQALERILAYAPNTGAVSDSTIDTYAIGTFALYSSGKPLNQLF